MKIYGGKRLRGLGRIHHTRCALCDPIFRKGRKARARRENRRLCIAGAE